MPKSEPVTVDGVVITHPERVISETGHITKRELADYYAGVAALLLPRIAGRPISLLRCPSGIDAGCFYQRNPGKGLGPDVKRFKFSHKGKKFEYLYIISRTKRGCWSWYRWARSNYIRGARAWMPSIIPNG